MLPTILTSIGVLGLLGIAIGVLLWHMRRAPWREFEALEQIVGTENFHYPISFSPTGLWLMKTTALFGHRIHLPGSRLWQVPDCSSPAELVVTDSLPPARLAALSACLVRIPSGISVRFQEVNYSDAEIARFIAPFAHKISCFTAIRSPTVGDQTLSALLPAARDVLQDLRLKGTAVTDAGLANLGKCSNLRFLILANDKITDAGLIHLAAPKSLWVLDLSGTQVTDAGMATVVQFPELHMFALQGTAVTDAGLEKLAGSKSLELLFLFNTKVTPAGIARLKAVCEKREQHLEIPMDHLFHMPQ